MQYRSPCTSYIFSSLSLVVHPFSSCPHLFPSLRTFLTSLSPVSSPLSLRVPFAPSCLFGLEKNHVLAVLVFNYAVWTYRRPALAARASHSDLWLVDRIVETAHLCFTSVTKAKAKVGKISSAANNALSVHDSTVSNIGIKHVICYTDGSALGNPGACGAGVSVFVPDYDLVLDTGVSLGTGTNNVGELVALILCFSILIQTFARFNFAKATVFSDSKYAINTLNSTRRSAINSALIDFLRAVYKRASELFYVSVNWIKGHSNVGGNNRVDALSRFFAGNDVFPINVAAPIHTMSFPFVERRWFHGFALHSVPIAFFVPCTVSISSSIWKWSSVSLPGYEPYMATQVSGLRKIPSVFHSSVYKKPCKSVSANKKRNAPMADSSNAACSPKRHCITAGSSDKVSGSSDCKRTELDAPTFSDPRLVVPVNSVVAGSVDKKRSAPCTGFPSVPSVSKRPCPTAGFYDTSSEPLDFKHSEPDASVFLEPSTVISSSSAVSNFRYFLRSHKFPGVIDSSVGRLRH